MAETAFLDDHIMTLVGHLANLRRDICEETQEPKVLEHELERARINFEHVVTSFRIMNEQREEDE